MNIVSAHGRTNFGRESQMGILSGVYGEFAEPDCTATAGSLRSVDFAVEEGALHLQRTPPQIYITPLDR